MQMKRSQAITEDDLLRLPPDIDGLVQEIKGQETVSSARQETHQAQDLKGKRDFLQVGKASDGGNGRSWDMFLQCSEYYEYRKRLGERRAYPIDIEIINTLKRCDINKLSTCNMINSILRAFIEENRDLLRHYVSETKSLI